MMLLSLNIAHLAVFAEGLPFCLLFAVGAASWVRNASYLFQLNHLSRFNWQIEPWMYARGDVLRIEEKARSPKCKTDY